MAWYGYIFVIMFLYAWLSCVVLVILSLINKIISRKLEKVKNKSEFNKEN